MLEHRAVVEKADAALESAETLQNIARVELETLQHRHENWARLREQRTRISTHLAAISSEASTPIHLDAVHLHSSIAEEQNDPTGRRATPGQRSNPNADSDLDDGTDECSGVECSLPAIIEYLDRVASSLEVYRDTIIESHAFGDLHRSRSEHAEAMRRQQRAQADHDEAVASKQNFKSLLENATEAKIAVTRQRFNAIEPIAADIYSRLDPHPAFTTIGFKHGRYSGRGELRAFVGDAGADVEADPLVVLSSSQANIAALACFLAVNLGAAERPLPFVMLDDPLQDMDDVNVLGFADLCRFLRTRRQLILSTHDRRFANLLRRKLTPATTDSRTIVHEFTAWHRRGPSVKTEYPAHEEHGTGILLLARAA